MIKIAKAARIVPGQASVKQAPIVDVGISDLWRSHRGKHRIQRRVDAQLDGIGMLSAEVERRTRLVNEISEQIAVNETGRLPGDGIEISLNNGVKEVRTTARQRLAIMNRPGPGFGIG